MDELTKVLEGGETQTTETKTSDVEGLKTTIGELTGKLDLMFQNQNYLAAELAKANQARTEVKTEEPATIETEQDIETVINSKVEKKFKEKEFKEAQVGWDRKTSDVFGKYGFDDTSSRFHNEVKKEFKNFGDPSPAAVYNAAARVKIKAEEEGWLKTVVTNNAVRNYNVVNGMGQGSTFGRTTTSEPEFGDMEKMFAAKLGVSEDFAKNAIKEKAALRMVK